MYKNCGRALGKHETKQFQHTARKIVLSFTTRFRRLAAFHAQLPRRSAILHFLMSSICFTPLSFVLCTQDMLLLKESVCRNRHLLNDNAAKHQATETGQHWSQAEGVSRGLTLTEALPLAGEQAAALAEWSCPIPHGRSTGAPGGLVTLWPIFQRPLSPSGKQHQPILQVLGKQQRLKPVFFIFQVSFHPMWLSLAT